MDARLVAQVRRKLGTPGTAADTVEAALRIALHVHPQCHIFALFGQISYESEYDIKELRRRGVRRASKPT